MGGGAFLVGGWRFSASWSEGLLFPIFVCLWVAGLWREDARQTRQNLLIAFAGLFVAPAIAGWFAPEASAHQRYWLALLPVMLLLGSPRMESVAIALSSRVILVFLAGLSLSTVHYFGRWGKGNVLEAARSVQAQSFSDTVVIVPKIPAAVMEVS